MWCGDSNGLDCSGVDCCWPFFGGADNGLRLHGVIWGGVGCGGSIAVGWIAMVRIELVWDRTRGELWLGELRWGGLQWVSCRGWMAVRLRGLPCVAAACILMGAIALGWWVCFAMGWFSRHGVSCGGCTVVGRVAVGLPCVDCRALPCVGAGRDVAVHGGPPHWSHPTTLHPTDGNPPNRNPNHRK